MQPAPAPAPASCRAARDPRAALAAHARADGPLRRVLAALAARLITIRGWERLGFARLGDYAVERLGSSARTLQDLAHVGAVLEARPALATALVSRSLGWTQVRLLARVVLPEDEAAWVRFAREQSVATLAREVRALDVGSVEHGALAGVSEGALLEEQRECVALRCSSELRGKWSLAERLARRVAGESMPTWECMEAVAAEALSALPVGAASEVGASAVSWDEASGDRGDVGLPVSHAARSATALASAPPPREAGACAAQGSGSHGVARSVASGASVRRPARESSGCEDSDHAHELPRFLQPLLVGLEDADAFELDARLRRAMTLEQGFEAQLADLLLAAAESQLHRDAGYRRFADFACEHAGLAPRSARSLLRLARAGRAVPALGEAWRGATLLGTHAHALVPLLVRAPGAAPAWLAWAGKVTVRRLREDVDRALILAAEDADAFERDAGLPPEARSSGCEPGESSASSESSEPSESIELARSSACSPASALAPPAGRQVRAAARAFESDRHARHRFFWLAPPASARFFRAVLCSARRHLERMTGRLPSDGEAFAAMLEHAIAIWCPPERRVRAAHRVFERDDWRCTAPGCTSYRNLQDHHVVFRSAGGGDELANRVTLCAWHHLRGVHAGRLRVTGRAPHGLRYAFGLRPGSEPLLRYASGDLSVESCRTEHATKATS